MPELCDEPQGTVTDYTYDAANRLETLEEKTALVGGDVIADYHYTLDANGNRLQEIQNEPQALPATTSATDVYAYNDERNRLTQAGATTFAYDYEGQLNDKSGTAYTFDYEHRLVRIDATGTSDRFFYDGAGRRLKAERISYGPPRLGFTTKYVYDLAGNLLAEADGAGTITRYYIHGLGLMAMVTPAGEGYNSYTYHYNGVGSTVAMTDSTGGIVNSYSYSPFGEVLAQTEATPQPFKFVGKYGVTAETGGLYHMRARYYDPQVGRFISEDPIGFAGGDVNLYGYVGNNPVLLVDPSGLIVVFSHNVTEEVKTSFNRIKGTKRGGEIIGALDATSIEYTINVNPHAPPSGGVYSQPRKTITLPQEFTSGTLDQNLAHELGHAYQDHLGQPLDQNKNILENQNQIEVELGYAPRPCAFFAANLPPVPRETYHSIRGKLTTISAPI